MTTTMLTTDVDVLASKQPIIYKKIKKRYPWFVKLGNKVLLMYLQTLYCFAYLG